MDHDKFQDDLEDVMKKHDVPLLVGVFRDGRDIVTFGIAGGGLDKASAEVLFGVIEAAVVQSKPDVNDACRKLIDPLNN